MWVNERGTVEVAGLNELQTFYKFREIIVEKEKYVVLLGGKHNIFGRGNILFTMDFSAPSIT